MKIHEELDRVILRTRWIRWSLRNYRDGDYRLGKNGRAAGRMITLSGRLSRHRPTWTERQPEAVEEMEGHI